MSLNVSSFDVNVLKNKTILDYNFKKGSEYTLTLEGVDGSVERVRIPAALANAMMAFSMLE